VAASLVLFAVGGAFGLLLVIPLMLKVLQSFVTPSMTQMLRLGELLRFEYNMCLACGILFQLPLVTLILAWMGVVTPAFLLKKWRHAIVIVLFITAIITPGDVASAQIFLGFPSWGSTFSASPWPSWSGASPRRFAMKSGPRPARSARGPRGGGQDGGGVLLAVDAGNTNVVVGCSRARGSRRAIA